MAKNLKVAIVHDWLVGGGAELVVEQLHKMYPNAPIYTSYATDEWRERLDNKVVTGHLQKLGGLRKYISVLRILWFTHLKLDDFDLVLSSSGAEAKGIKTKARHINYCHAPTHYYWSRYDEYLANPGFGPFNFLARLGLRLLIRPLKRWDKKAAGRPDVMIANSTHIQKEIQKYYGRDSVVVHPPVNVERFKNSNKERSGFVVVGRQTPYKRMDLAVAACSELGLTLNVVGRGPDNVHLRTMAGPTINFDVEANDKKVVEYLSHAEAFIFPGLDDFGISAVEALAAGTPVIAYKAGGALDFVEPGKTGEFFESQTSDSLVKVLKKIDASKYKHSEIAKYATRFSAQNFRGKMFQLINEKAEDG
ncbi:MAG: glycosyltransferase [bacterium]|nr:glycosyltransferase [bacterium]